MTSHTTVVVIGLGYIGLPTAAVLAAAGAQVIGVDVNPAHVAAINQGRVPFVEPELATHVAKAVQQGRLAAFEEIPADVPGGSTFIIAVPTPMTDGHDADLGFIEAATDSLIPHLGGGELVILESTSPPGTTQYIADRVHAARPDLATNNEGNAIHFAHCPERVLPGRVMIELIENDRIIGGLTQTAAERARALYASFCTGDILLTDATTAELAKLAENSFRDVNIAFANELSMIADSFNVDVFELIRLANRHPRVNILQPGPGVGGHCIAVDPWFIVSSSPEQARLIRTAREVNDSKPAHVVATVLSAAAQFDSPVIACLGLSFKPDIDDLRESPSVNVVRQLSTATPEAEVLVVEPNISALPPDLESVRNVALTPLWAAIERADIVLLLVDHREFREITPSQIQGKTLIDTKGVWR